MTGIKTDEKGKFVKGTAPGPGRPKGSISVITKIKQQFEADPEGFDEFIERYKKNPMNEKHLVEMIDGKPNQKGELEVTMPKPLLHAIFDNDSNQEDNEAEQED
jgi:hypothetical protein